MTKERNNIDHPREGEIDVVYIWCDSNHPEYIKNRKKYSKQYKLNSFWSTTRDHNEIKYSIMSVRKNMKWVRNIYICAPKNHKVKNLDEKEYGVKYVTNAEILGKENTPNFNSHSLELFTHKIKGLSDYFIQFNDDFFVNQKNDIDDFYNFKTKKIKYFYENILILSGSLSPTTREYIQDLTGEKYYFWPTHSPRMFYKNDVEDIIKTYKNISDYTKTAKFRTKEDFQLVYFYGYYLLSKNKGKFIFLNNFSKNSFLSTTIILFGKLFSEGIKSFCTQIYLQLFYKKHLHKNKNFSSSNIYSLIRIGNSYKKNKQNIDSALKNKIKFICLNDSYKTEDKDLLSKISKENYEYFYKELLK